MGYDDGLIDCSAAELEIRYGMFLRTRRVPYADFRGVEELELRSMRKWRLWGTTDLGSGSTWAGGGVTSEWLS